jgi:hypothetical protein
MKSKPRFWHLAAITAYVAVILGILHKVNPQKTLSTGEWLATVAMLMLIPWLLAGLIRAIGQFSRRGELYGREILWLWVGSVLFQSKSASFFCPVPWPCRGLHALTP